MGGDGKVQLVEFLGESKVNQPCGKFQHSHVGNEQRIYAWGIYAGVVQGGSGSACACACGWGWV
jgi:hypothetical protein